MPAPGYGGGATGTTSGFTPSWASGASPAPAAPDAGAAAATSAGNFTVDPTSPQGLAGSVQGVGQTALDAVNGLGTALFGPSGWIGGPAAALSKVPVLGPVGQGLIGAGSAVVGAGLDVAKAAAGGVSDLANLNGFDPMLPGATNPFIVAQQYGQVDPTIRAKYDPLIQADPMHSSSLMDQALQAQQALTNQSNPDIFSGADLPTATLGDTLGKIMTTMGLGQRAVERTIAGGVPGSQMNRLDEVMRMAQSSPGLLTPVEQTVAANVQSGKWTQAQATDYLTINYAGLSHNPGLEVLGTFVTDPTVLGAFGLGAAAKVGEEASALSRTAETLGEAARGTSLIGRTSVGTAALKGVAAVADKVPSGLIQAAQTLRNFVDPLHAISSGTRTGSQVVDVMSQMAPQAIERAHGLGYVGLLHIADNLDPTGALADQMTRNLSTYSGNLATKALASYHRLVQLATGAGADLVGKPSDAVDAIMASGSAPANFFDKLTSLAGSVAKNTWTPADMENLVMRAVAMYGKTAEDWTPVIASMSKEELSLFHALTYGQTIEDFLPAWQEAIRSAQLGGHAGLPLEALQRLHPVNEQTFFSQDAKVLLSNLEGAGTLADRVAIVRQAQHDFPELANWVDLAHGDPNKSISYLVSKLEDRLGMETRDAATGAVTSITDRSLPSRLSQQEISQLPNALQDLAQKIKGAYTFGFRPPQEQLWGLERDAQGMLIPRGDPWVDLRAATTPGYRPTFHLPVNVAGMPVIGEAANTAARAVDYMAAGSRQMLGHVQAMAIQENVDRRLTAALVKVGADTADAKGITAAVRAAAQVDKTTAGALQATVLWDRVKGVIPPALQAAGMTDRDLMSLVMHAYQGDMRLVGLGNKIAGVVKTELSGWSDNLEGKISQDLYQTIKFRSNPFFQVQEHISSFVLASMRGVVPALGTKMSEADQVGFRLGQALMETGLNMNADTDMIEYGARGVVGNDLGTALSSFNQGKLAQVLSALPGLPGRNVRGTMQLDQIRVMQKGLGAIVKPILDTWDPNGFQSWVDHYVATLGHGVTPDEAAARWLQEQAFGGNIRIDDLIQGRNSVDFANALQTSAFHAPTDIGQVKSLNLNFLARAFASTKGDLADIGDVSGLRRALATGRMKIDDLTNFLDGLSAPPAYTQRVQNALSFNYPSFLDGLKTSFNLTPEELSGVDRMFANSAALRRMTPAEYVSQFFDPAVHAMPKGQTGAAVHALTEVDPATQAAKAAVSVLRAPKDATSADLMQQLVQVWQHHLDPSGQQVLMDAMQATGERVGGGIVRGGTVESGGAIRAAGAAATDQRITVADLRAQVGDAEVERLSQQFPDRFSQASSGSRSAKITKAAVKFPDGSRGDYYLPPAEAAAAPTFDASGLVGAPVWGTPAGDSALAQAVLARAVSGVKDVNPDVERAFQHFSQWTQSALMQGLLREQGSQSDAMAKLLEQVVGIPTDNAVGHNMTQQLLLDQAMNALSARQDDAFSLLFFNRNRTLLERSLNHPFFGLYPVSFMYGKVLPAIVRFIAKDPFGIDTGALAYGLRDVQMSVAMQKSQDPAFAKEIDSIGANPAIFWLGYLMPSNPFSVDVSLPAPLRNLAAQGLANQAAVQAGREPKPIDLAAMLNATVDYMNPVHRAEQVIGGFLKGGLKPILQNTIGAAEQPSTPPQQPVPSLGSVVQATGLHPVLEQQLQSLAGVLSNP